MLDWLSDNRALVAAVIILCLVGSFFASIFYGLKQTRLREKDQVFGDPERTVGGWFWAVCGVSTLLLVWFYFSWGSARAFFPQAANELCQVAKLHEAVSPVTSSLAIESRYSKSKTLLVRNSRQLDELQARLPANVFSPADAARVTQVMQNTQQLISMMATPDFVDQKTIADIQAIKAGYAAIPMNWPIRNQAGQHQLMPWHSHHGALPSQKSRCFRFRQKAPCIMRLQAMRLPYQKTI